MKNETDRNIKNMAGRATESALERVRTLIDAMLEGGVPTQTRRELDQWFASSASREEKNHVIAERLYQELSTDTRAYAEPDEDTKRRFAKLCAELGIQTTRDTSVRPKKQVLLRRSSWWVAAAVIPFFVIVGSVWLWSVRDKTVDVSMVSAIGIESQTVIEAYEGVQKDVYLPDSTRVWVNSGSKLTFPEPFTDARSVTLDGEAYFDVRHDARKPFVVRTEHIDVRVLGTRFDVTAFSGSGTAEVELFEGSVEVLRGAKTLRILVPGEKLVYHQRTGKYTVTAQAIPADWRSEIVYAKDRTLPELFRMIGNYYDVEIVYNETDFTQGDLYDSAFGKEYTSENVINSLSLLSGIFTYTVQDGRIVIGKKETAI